MPRIHYIPIDFNPLLDATLAANNPMSCTWADMFWAAITVGRASWNKVVRDDGRILPTRARSGLAILSGDCVRTAGVATNPLPASAAWPVAVKGHG